jgi:hypothetical protein
MRTVLMIALASLLGACSFLDELDFSATQQLDPNRIYLGSARVYSVSARDARKYACVSGPLLCETRGIGFDCRCQ